MDNKEWLSNLKVGDNVIVFSGGGMGSRDVISTVKRLTKTLIITTKGRYRRDDGYSSGGGLYRNYLGPLTNESIAKIKKANLVRHFQNYNNWEKISLETLKSIFELMS